MRPSSTPPPSLVLSRRSFAVKALLATVGGLGWLRTTRAQAPDPNAPRPLPENVSLRDLMTPEQFKAAGLKKLSPEELQRLERFLQGYREQVVQQEVKATEERVNPPPKRNRATAQNVIQARIQGHFAGLTGRTRMVLDNGSIWQEVNGETFAASLDNPEVVMVRSVFGYKMYVTGAPQSFYVKQVVVN